MSLRLACFILSLMAADALRAEAPNPGSFMITPDARLLAQSNNQFALKLYGKLSAKQSGNLFFSPYSISTALAMTFAGAEGMTERQMAEALGFSLPEERLNAAFASLREANLPNDAKSGCQLRTANRLWGQQGYNILPGFQQTVRTSYGAELAPVDFARQAESSRQAINSWVAKETEQKIQDLIAPGVLDPLTRLVLTNAIYFKGAWTDEFKKSETKDAPFHLAGQRQVAAPLMRQTHDFKHAAINDVQLLELPYGRDRQLSMVVVLPTSVDGLAQVENKLSIENLQKWTDAARSRQVDAYLPRFKMTSQFQLQGVLESLGMTLAFRPGQADFSGICTEEPLCISAVVHKAFVDVNEEGTEAAAATGIAIGNTAARASEEPVVFRADHPFLFLIRENRSGSMLFLGRVANPRG